MKVVKVKKTGAGFAFIVMAVVGGPFWAASLQGADPPAKEQQGVRPLAERMAQKITYSCNDLPIDMVLVQLTELADIDIIKSPDVTGNVTVRITDIPLSEALTNILAAYGWAYVPSENMIRVVTMSEILEKKKQEEEQRIKEIRLLEKYVTKIYRVTYADAEVVAQGLAKFISKDGAVVVNRGTSIIMITESESRISAIDKYIEEIDRETPQILVEVRIYDIAHTSQLDLGVDWTVGRNTSFDSDGNPVSGRTNPFIQGSFSGGGNFADTTQGLFRFGILNSSLNLDALIKAQEEILDAELLANPRIRVLDNETATFKSIREIPYKELSESYGGGALTSTKFKEVGVKLEVTPHITREGMIRLRVKPEFGIVVRLPEDGPPTVDTRVADTITLVKDGQTIVLGGLRKKETRRSVSKIPLLGDIPLLGALFRMDGEEEFDNELVVFITPRIIKKEQLSEYEDHALKETEFEYPQMLLPMKERDILEKPYKNPPGSGDFAPAENGDKKKKGFVPRL